MAESTAHAYDGLALTKIREAGGEETVRFEATIVRHGLPVGTVSNGGTGGPHLLRFRDLAAEFAFNSLAGRLFPDAHEPGDRLVDRLLLAAQLNRARTVSFILDGDDPFETGRYRGFRAGVTVDMAVANLSGPGYVPRNPKVWVKERSDFVPVTDLTR